MKGRDVLLGLGANLGDPLSQLRHAVNRIAQFMVLDAVSRVYLTSPVGKHDQPDFHNLVCRGDATIAPRELLAAVRGIEEAAGRQRTVRDGPRSLDIDILAFGDEVVNSDDLVLPHPRMHLRRFVLEPLVEIAPDWTHPTLDVTAEQLLAMLPVGGERVTPLGLLDR